MKNIHNNSKKHDYHIRKDSGSARTIQKIRQLFLTGHSFTARELNVLAGLDVVNCRLSDRRKVYRLEKGGER